jgi:hypothetical protein
MERFPRLDRVGGKVKVWRSCQGWTGWEGKCGYGEGGWEGRWR